MRYRDLRSHRATTRADVLLNDLLRPALRPAPLRMLEPCPPVLVFREHLGGLSLTFGARLRDIAPETPEARVLLVVVLGAFHPVREGGVADSCGLCGGAWVGAVADGLDDGLVDGGGELQGGW